jgi:hypothetical protein
MNAFIVDLKNRPGELGRLAQAIADQQINITGFSGATCGDSGSVALITDNEAKTGDAIRDAGFSGREVELVEVSMANRPGTLAEVAAKLGNAGVNIEAAIPTGMAGGDVHVAFATDNPSQARSLLGDRVLSGANR